MFLVEDNAALTIVAFTTRQRQTENLEFINGRCTVNATSPTTSILMIDQEIR
jgi:hypothetical protein